MLQKFSRSITVLLLLAVLMVACAAPASETTADLEQPAASEMEASEENKPSGEVEEAAEEDQAEVEEPLEAGEEEAEAEVAEADASEEVEEVSDASAEKNEEEAGDAGETAEDVELEGGNINVYISPDSLGMALEAAFEVEHGDVLTIVGGPWCRKVKAEQEAGDIQADVICGAEPVFYKGLAKSGALLSYTSPKIDSLTAEFQWDNGFFLPSSLSYIGIVYNKTLVDEADLPETFAGLNDPQWDALLAMPDATQCASALAIAAAFAQPDLDMSYFEGAKANDALLSDRAGKLPEMVASGEAALGVGPHDPVVRLQNKARKEGVESPVAIAWAEEGAYAIPRPVAIIADENRSEEETKIAQAFVDFILSPKGQNIIVKNAGYVPVVDGVEWPALVSSDIELIDIDWDWAAQNKAEIQEAFQSVMYGSN